jgi:hypothetical protein
LPLYKKPKKLNNLRPYETGLRLLSCVFYSCLLDRGILQICLLDRGILQIHALNGKKDNSKARACPF